MGAGACEGGVSARLRLQRGYTRPTLDEPPQIKVGPPLKQLVELAARDDAEDLKVDVLHVAAEL